MSDKKNPGGRPRKDHKILNIRLDSDLAGALERMVSKLGSTKTACVEQAISEWIVRQSRRLREK